MRKKDYLTIGIASTAEAEPPESKSHGELWKDRRFTQQGYLFWLNAAPIRSYPGYALPDTLTATETGRCYQCALMLEKETNMIFHKVNGVNKPLSIKQLANRLKLSERQCYRFIQRMIELRIMKKEQGRIYINPCYFFRGRYLSYHLYELFKPELQAVLPKWVTDRYEGNAQE
jgi:predicted transcriptional regulator